MTIINKLKDSGIRSKASGHPDLATSGVTRSLTLTGRAASWLHALLCVWLAHLLPGQR